MSLGLKRGTVQLEPHDKQWDEAAIQTIKILKSILGDDAIDIQERGAENVKIPEKSVFIELFGGCFLSCGTVMGLKVTVKSAAVLKMVHRRRQTGA